MDKKTENSIRKNIEGGNYEDIDNLVLKLKSKGAKQLGTEELKKIARNRSNPFRDILTRELKHFDTFFFSLFMLLGVMALVIGSWLTAFMNIIFGVFVFINARMFNELKFKDILLEGSSLSNLELMAMLGKIDNDMDEMMEKIKEEEVKRGIKKATSKKVKGGKVKKDNK